MSLVLLVGCGALDPFEKVEEGLRGEGPQKPTWAKKYDIKTCRSWRSQMSRQEKLVASKDMLTFLRVRDVAPLYDAEPADGGLIRAFREEVAGVCSMLTAGTPLRKAAQHAYLGDAKYRPPIPQP